MTSKAYFKKRAKQNVEYAKSIEDKFLELQKAEYSRQLKNIDNAVTNIYAKMLEKGEISNTELYAFNRYKKLRKQITSACKELGQGNRKEMYSALKSVYKHTFNNTSLTEKEHKKALNTTWGKLDEDRMNTVLNQTRYGSDFSDRIWDDCDKLAKNIDKDVKSIISGGKTLAECKKAIKNNFNNSFYNVNRLVRTESMYAMNTATLDKYTKLGVKKYQFISAHDSRTSEICSSMDGKIFETAKAVSGENLPPLHPHCRSTIIPILDDETENISEKDSKALTEQPKQAKIDLKDDDIQAINTYISSESYTINDILRNGGQLSPEQLAFCEQLDKTLDKMPEFEGTVYRSITSDYIDDIEAFNRKYAVDECIIEPSFVSTSLEVYDNTMDIQFIIKSKHGKDISSINENEKEILFKRNSKFIVTDRQGNTIYMEEL